MQNNPLRFVDPFGLCSQDAGGGYQDSDDGGTFLFSGPCANGSRGNYDPSPTAPPVLNGPDPNNLAVEGNTVTAQSDPFSFGDLFNAGLDFITNSIVPLTGTLGVGLPQADNSIGPQISVAYIPKTHQLCVSGGFYVTTPGSSFINLSGGLLVNGPLEKAESIVSGFGTSGTLQTSLHGGY